MKLFRWIVALFKRKPKETVLDAAARAKHGAGVHVTEGDIVRAPIEW